MTPDAIRAWITLVETVKALGPLGFALGIIYVLYKGLYISKRESDERVASEVAKSAALLAVEQEKVALLRTELEKREGLYVASLSELRATIKDGNTARERVQAALDKNVEQMYRFADVLGDIRDAIKQPPRGTP